MDVKRKTKKLCLSHLLTATRLPMMFLCLVIASCSILLVGCDKGKNNATEPGGEVVTPGGDGPSEGTPDDGGNEMITYKDVVSRLYDNKWYAQSNLLDERSYQTSTADPAATYDEATDTYVAWEANADGVFRNLDENGNPVILEINGRSGYLSRIWFAKIYKGSFITVEVDGQVVVESDLLKYFVGDDSLEYYDTDYYVSTHNRAYTSNHEYDMLTYISSNGYNSFLPITFNNSIKVTLSSVFRGAEVGIYNQVNYTLFPEGTKVESFVGFDENMSEENKLALKEVNDKLSGKVAKIDGTAYSVESNKFVTVYDDQNAGAITSLQLSLTDNLTELEMKKALRDLFIEVYYDGKTYPSMSISIGDLFGSPAGLVEYSMKDMGVTADGVLYLNMYMPYEKAVIKVGNQGSKTYNFSFGLESCDITEEQAKAEMRFIATWKKSIDRDVTSDRWPDVTTFTATGKGRVLGQVWHTYQKYYGFWWGEGDERFFVDGEKYPSWLGTGAEDIIGYAFAIPESWEFSSAYRAHPVGAGDSSAAGDKVNTYMLVTGSVPFEKGIEMSLEKYFDDDYCYHSSTTYFYIQSEYLDNNKPTAYNVSNRNACAPLTVEEIDIPEFIRYEGEHIMSTMTVSQGKLYEEWFDVNWSGRRHACWFGTGTGGATMSFPINVGKDGNYNLAARFTTAADYPIVNVLLDGKVIARNINLYTPGLSGTRVEFGLHELSEGNHMVTIQVAGIDSRATTNNGNNVIGLDYFDCQPEDIIHIEGSDIFHHNVYTNGGSILQEVYFDSSATGTNFITFINMKNAEGVNSFKYDFEHSGNYTIQASFIMAYDFPLLGICIDGVQVGELVDLYHGGHKTTGVITFGDIDISKGEHIISFITPSKSDKSAGYVFAVDFIDFVANEYYEDPESNNKTGVISYEVENLVPYSTQVDGGELMHQNIWFGRDGAQMLWIDNKVGSTLEINFNVPYTGVYDLRTRFCNADDFAIFDLYVDGKLVLENVDMYSTVLGASQEFSLGSHEFAEGKHTIKVVIKGKNEASRAYLFAIDYLDLVYETEEKSIRYEMESDDINRQSAGGNCWTQYKDSLYSDKTVQLITDCGVGAYYTMDIIINEDGNYTLKGGFIKAHDFATLRIYVDGVQVGNDIDFYSPREMVTERMLIGSLDLTAGTHTIKFEVVGKNEASVAYVVGVDYIDVIKN